MKYEPYARLRQLQHDLKALFELDKINSSIPAMVGFYNELTTTLDHTHVDIELDQVNINMNDEIPGESFGTMTHLVEMENTNKETLANQFGTAAHHANVHAHEETKFLKKRNAELEENVKDLTAMLEEARRSRSNEADKGSNTLQRLAAVQQRCAEKDKEIKASNDLCTGLRKTCNENGKKIVRLEREVAEAHSYIKEQTNRIEREAEDRNEYEKFVLKVCATLGYVRARPSLTLDQIFVLLEAQINSRTSGVKKEAKHKEDALAKLHTLQQQVAKFLGGGLSLSELGKEEGNS